MTPGGSIVSTAQGSHGTRSAQLRLPALLRDPMSCSLIAGTKHGVLSTAQALPQGRSDYPAADKIRGVRAASI